MSDRVNEAASRLNAILMPVAKMRIETMGLEESGAYNFYDVRVGHGTLFADYELEIARRFDAMNDRPKIVHEIGVGWGQLSFLLSALGISTVALEADRRRYAAGAALHGVITAASPAEAQHSQVLYEKFPSSDLDPRGALALATNLVFTTSPAERRSIVAALATYKTSIIDVDRFLVHGKSVEERRSVIAEFESAGLKGELFADLGDSACFYRFTGDS